MSGIKFWKGDENLRPVYKKPFYRNIDWLLVFRTFSFIESRLCYKMKTFNKKPFYRNIDWLLEFRTFSFIESRLCYKMKTFIL
jgi:hypothetical protein